MPTRAELDAAKQALSQEIQTVASHISNLNQQVAALQQQLAGGNPITAEDLADLQADLQALQATDLLPGPPPTP